MVFTVDDYNQMHPQETPLTQGQFNYRQQRERARNYAIANFGERGQHTYEYNMDQRPPHPVRNLLRNNWVGSRRTMRYGSNLRTALSGKRSARGKNANRVLSMGNPFLDSQIEQYLGVEYRPPTPTPPTVRRKGTRSLSNGKKKKSSRRRTHKAKSR
jgi:hypothetical protein